MNQQARRDQSEDYARPENVLVYRDHPSGTGYLVTRMVDEVAHQPAPTTRWRVVVDMGLQHQTVYVRAFNSVGAMNAAEKLVKGVALYDQVTMAANQHGPVDYIDERTTAFDESYGTEATLEDQQTRTYYKLLGECAKIRSVPVRFGVRHIIVQGELNANQTILVERAAKASEWDAIFVGSIVSLLSDTRYVEELTNVGKPLARHVVAFFAKHGIRA